MDELKLLEEQDPRDAKLDLGSKLDPCIYSHVQFP